MRQHAFHRDEALERSPIGLRDQPVEGILWIVEEFRGNSLRGILLDEILGGVLRSGPYRIISTIYPTETIDKINKLPFMKDTI